MNVLQIPLAVIDPPEHVHRASMDEQQLTELAASIKSEGLLVPILLRDLKNGRYSIIAGHRRFTAHEWNRATYIDAIVRDIDEGTAELQRITENAQRADLTPLEEAVTLARLADDQALSTKQIAKLVSRSEWYVTRRLQLLSMPDDLKEPVHQGQLSAGTALLLADVPDEPHRKYLTEYAIRSGASTWVVKGWVADWHTAQARGEPITTPEEVPTSDAGEVTVMMPCYACRKSTDHRKLIIRRLCGTCDEAIDDARELMENLNKNHDHNQEEEQ